ncbi:MAG: alpha amylase C-terminal domain-containing protein, partial [Oscillospiraceae bacterium]
VIFMRKDKRGKAIISLSNFSNVEYKTYSFGVPIKGYYKEIFNTNDEKYGGDGIKNIRAVRSKKGKMHGRDNFITVDIPPMSTLYFSVPEIKK